MFSKQIDLLKQPRQMVISILNELTLDQLNEIPPGFRNNIIWNLGHIIAVQQNLCYLLSFLGRTIPDEIFDLYRSGTKPERLITAAEVAEVKRLLISTLDQLEVDLKNGLFITYDEKLTRYGVKLTSVEDAISFLPFHDGLHIGTIMAMNKLVTK